MNGSGWRPTISSPKSRVVGLRSTGAAIETVRQSGDQGRRRPRRPGGSAMPVGGRRRQASRWAPSRSTPPVRSAVEWRKGRTRPVISHHSSAPAQRRPSWPGARPEPARSCWSESPTIVTEAGLGVVSRLAVPFGGGGLTLVWVLAESHLVLHFWPEEATATVDLHVCDYQRSNADRARDLVARLRDLLFVAGSDRWQELEVGRPLPACSSVAD